MRPDSVLLSAYLDGEVPEKYRDEIERYVRTDPVCGQKARELTELRAALLALDEPDIERLKDESFQSVKRRVAVRRPGILNSRWRQIRVPVPVLAAAAALLVALTGVVIWRLLPESPASASDYIAQGKDVDVTIRVDDAQMEHVLQWLADKEMLGEVSIQLPEQQFRIVGEPVLLKPENLPRGLREPNASARDLTTPDLEESPE